VLSLVCTAGSAVLTWKFGVAQSADPTIAAAIATVLVCFSLASDYIWLFAKDAWRRRQRGMTATLIAGGLVVLTLNLGSNLGSVGWQQDTVTADALRREANFTQATERATMSKDKRAMLERLAQDLRAQHPWAADTTADALRRQIVAKKRDAALEAANVRCGSACRKLQAEVTELERQLGIVERREDYDGQIAAIERALSAQADKVEATSADRTVAAPVAQAAMFASFWQRSLKPSDEARTWSQRLVQTAIAIGLVVGPIVFGQIGWPGTPSAPGLTPAVRPSAADETAAGVSPPGDLVPVSATPMLAAVAPPTSPLPGSTTIVQQRFNDARFARLAAELLAPYRRDSERLAA